MANLIILKHLYKAKDGFDLDWEIHLNIKINDKYPYLDATITCFSNDTGEYEPLDKSIIVEFLSDDEAKECIKYYENIKTEYLKYLNDTIKTKKQLDEYIYKLNNPITNYNYKLLNVFSFEELEYINNELFIKYVFLDPNDFTKFVDRKLSGWYGFDTEVNTDLDDNDYPEILHLIDDDERLVSAKEALEIMKRAKDKQSYQID